MPGNANSGRRSQPAKVLQMKGRRPGVDSGGRKIPDVPEFRRGAPDAPAWLSDEARAEWDRVVPGLQLLDILKPEDRANLAAYCETWATFVMATRRVQDEGETVEHTTYSHGPNGRTTRTNEIVNPFIAVARAAGKELRGFAAQFGLTPSSETALGKAGGGDGGDEDNPFT
jgi:P27 family predicted phage terminase small subunit